MIRDTLDERLINKERIRNKVLNSIDVHRRSKINSFEFKIIEISTFACVILLVAIISISKLNIRNSSNQNNSINSANDSLTNISEYYKATIGENENQNKTNYDIDYNSMSYAVDVGYPFVIYKNRIYNLFQSVNNDTAKKIELSKIGITNKDANDYYNSKQSLDINSIYSTMSTGTEIYSIKGYDPNIRILVNDINSSIIFESLENVKINSFKELVKLLNLDTNFLSANILINSSTSGPVTSSNSVTKKEISSEKYNNLINILNEASLINSTEVLNYFKKTGKNENKGVEILLKDGTNISLVIYSSGYINYRSLYFKITSDSFKKIYNEI